MKVKVMVLNKDKKTDREFVIDDFEKSNNLFDVEDDLEGAVDQALDVLTESAPSAFASEKDGKIYGYRFEILDPEYNSDFIN